MAARELKRIAGRRKLKRMDATRPGIGFNGKERLSDRRRPVEA